MSPAFDPLRIPLAGTQLIEASAGTGKTYSITTLYLRLLLEKRLSVDQILVVTFTEAATKELHERVRSRLREAALAFQNGASPDPVLKALYTASSDRQRDLFLLKRALGDIDEASISTIHGFCRRILEQQAFESGMPFDLELTAEHRGVMREVIEDYTANALYDADPRIVAILLREFSCEALFPLAVEAVRHRDFPVVSRLADSPPLEEALATATEAYRRAKAIWKNGGSEIMRELTPDKRFNKAVRDSLHNGLTRRIDQYLDHAAPPEFLLPDHAEALTRSRLVDPDAGVCAKAAIRKGDVPRHRFFADWESFTSALTELTDRVRFDHAAEFVDHVRQEFPRRLRMQGLQSFDDLLYSLDRALAGAGGERLARLIGRRYPAALIDEFQDTDPVQYRIFEKIYGTRDADTAFFMIGDPKQAIYAFRGADIFAYLKAATEADRKHTMHTNWRSDPGFVNGMNELFSGSTSPFFEPRITYPEISPRPGAGDLWATSGDHGAAIQFLCLGGDHRSPQDRIPAAWLTENIPRLVAQDIGKLLRGGAIIDQKPVEPRDIAVLVRTNQQAMQMQEALGRAGIHAVLHSRANVFASREAEALDRLLLAVLNPRDLPLMRAALATDFFNLTARDLLECDETAERLLPYLDLFHGWHRDWQDRGFMKMMQSIEHQLGLAARLLPFADGERRLTNLRHLTELLHAAERQDHHGPLSLYRWFSEKQRAEEVGEEAELRLESDASAITLVTTHKSKGLEYPVVYCPFFWSAGLGRRQDWFFIYHEPDDDWRGKIALFPDDRQRQHRRNELFAENLRLLYVALTRAKHCCMVLWAPSRSYPESALAYLLHRHMAPPGQAADLDEWFSQVRGLAADHLLTDLKERVAGSANIGMRFIALEPAPLPAVPEPQETAPLRCLALKTRMAPFWRVGSFSQFVAGTPEPAHFHEAEQDKADPAEASLPQAGERETLLPLVRFPKGAAAGNFFHKIFELYDFQDREDETLPDLIDRQLQLFGFSRDTWRDPVRRGVREIIQTNLLQNGTLRLADIASHQRLNELPFTFPVAQSDNDLDAFAGRQLAGALAAFPHALPAAYLKALDTLDFLPLKGYLKGFIDLVFEHQGLWYLVDFKSNHLGEERESYGAAGLPLIMAEHHYYLQYHIYTVALHRHLAMRLPGYAYQRHFGGVFYLFIRGMTRDNGPAYGVFFDRPPIERIELLSSLFTAPQQLEEHNASIP